MKDLNTIYTYKSIFFAGFFSTNTYDWREGFLVFAEINLLLYKKKWEERSGKGREE